MPHASFMVDSQSNTVGTCIQLSEDLNLLDTRWSLVGHFFLRQLTHMAIGGS